MPDLIIHLGLTKTASSFLQRKVFKGKMNTLENAIGWEDDALEAKYFEECFRNNSPFFWRDKGGRIAFFDDSKNGSKNVLISHESLYHHVPFHGKEEQSKILCEPVLVSERLREMAENAWGKETGRVKVFFFFRKQSEWLPSIYSHVCYGLQNPSQSDFDQRVRDLISGNSNMAHAIDYSLLLEHLRAALGEHSVLAMPYEAFNEKETWERLREFTGVADLGADADLNLRDVNVKRLPDEKDWRLSGKAQPLEGNVLVRRMGYMMHPFLNKSQEHRIKQKIKSALMISDKRIGIGDTLSREVKEFYEESNRRLATMIDMDLSKYNYY